MSKREVLFRGKNKDTGEWVVGNLVIGEDPNAWASIITKSDADQGQPFNEYDVDCETISEFTNLYDKHGTQIFEHDILRVTTPRKVTVCSVIYEDGLFIGVDRYDIRCEFATMADVEIIGNIHDNPELLEACNG